MDKQWMFDSVNKHFDKNIIISSKNVQEYCMCKYVIKSDARVFYMYIFFLF